MRITLYNTPVVTPLLTLLAKTLLHLSGWRICGKPPKAPRYIVVGAPHTSHWDFILAIAISLCCHTHCRWLADARLFWGPFGIIMRWMAAIPVNKQRKTSMVSQTICAYKQMHQLGILICPEGGRNKNERWHTGFYHIAKNANIPIILGYLDFNKKEGGFGPAIKVSNSLAKDFAEIEAFYSNIYGKFPESVSPIKARG